jgi:hypothetical protein
MADDRAEPRNNSRNNSVAGATERATACATAAQQPSLKALAQQALARNNSRNSRATDLLRVARPRECNNATTAESEPAQPVTRGDLLRVARPSDATAQQRAEPEPALPRLVTCEGCRHFLPDPVNPAAGAGACAIGKGMESIGPALHPMAPRYCWHFAQRQPS